MTECCLLLPLVLVVLLISMKSVAPQRAPDAPAPAMPHGCMWQHPVITQSNPIVSGDDISHMHADA